MHLCTSQKGSEPELLEVARKQAQEEQEAVGLANLTADIEEKVKKALGDQLRAEAREEVLQDWKIARLPIVLAKMEERVKEQLPKTQKMEVWKLKEEVSLWKSKFGELQKKRKGAENGAEVLESSDGDDVFGNKRLKTSGADLQRGPESTRDQTPHSDQASGTQHLDQSPTPSSSQTTSQSIQAETMIISNDEDNE